MLSKHKYNGVRAQHICNSLGTDLVEVHDNSSKEDLKTYMGNHGIGDVHAGLYIDPRLNEALFESNGAVATDVVFKEIFYYWKGERWVHKS